MEYIKIGTLDNLIEAQIIEDILTEQQIPYFVRSYHDSAYQGLFQLHKGWGELYSIEEFKDKIEEVLEALRENQLEQHDLFSE